MDNQTKVVHLSVGLRIVKYMSDWDMVSSRILLFKRREKMLPFMPDNTLIPCLQGQAATWSMGSVATPTSINRITIRNAHSNLSSKECIRLAVF